MLRQKITKLIESSIKKLQKEKVFFDFELPEIKVEVSENKNYGDYSSSIAMAIGKYVRKNPMETAETIKLKVKSEKLKVFEKIEVAKPGFINFCISKNYLQKQIGEILKQGKKFGELKIGKGKKINVEFISANPTGPLTLGNGRGGFCGDTLANVLKKSGFNVSREYYINDVGEQVRKLGHSVIGDAEAVYKGKYIEELRKKIKGKELDKIGQEGAKFILETMIKPTVKKMGINFDVWFSEKNLHRQSEVNKALDYLKKKKFAYEKEGALYFNSTKFGDDKDRVLIKSDGETTYLVSDIAYLKNKFERGFKRLIYIWGADHYGYIGRIKAAAEALGFSKENVDIIIMQLVRLFKEGKEVRMSKRAGVYATLEELIDEVGLDAARFFFLSRGPESHLNFDLDLAKEKSEKNPVYYIQYAYARIFSIIRKLKVKSEKLKVSVQNLKLLNHPSELELIKQMVRFPEVIEDTAMDYQVQRLPQYAIDLATVFHQFYRDCRVISENKDLTQARLSLILAVKIVLKNTFDLMRISAPEKM